MTKKLTYDDIQDILDSGCGDKYYKTTFNSNFVITRCVYMFFEECEAFWFGDLINSYIPKIYNEMIKFDDRFFIVTLQVNKSQREGYLTIQREVYDEKIEDTLYCDVVKQEIPFIDLPQGNYKFYLIAQLTEQNNIMFIMLSPSEY